MEVELAFPAASISRNATDLPQFPAESTFPYEGADLPGDFETLQRFAKAHQRRERKLFTANTSLPAVFKRALPEIEVVSFDIFDTALIRHVHHPVDVFFHLAQHAAFRAHSLSGSLAPRRIAAEQTARNLVFQQIGSYEVNLLEIYQVFCDLNGISREYAESLMEAEEQIEMQLCIPCPPLKRLAQESQRAGKKVVFTSDTYHRVDFLVRLLNGIGYCVNESLVFASSAYRKSKQDGSLFPPVLAALGVPPEKLLHLGDHPVSDESKPRSLGIRTILHAHKASAETPELLHVGPSRSAADDAALAQRSVVSGLVRATWSVAERHGQGDDFWWKFGYSSVGPLTTGFCEWLEESLRQDGMEHAYFLLRDGELLHAVYDRLFREVPGACRASTLESSRRAMLLPVIELAPGFVVPSMLGGIGKRPLREYLHRLAVSADGFEQEAAAAGFHSLDEKIDNRFDMPRLFHFVSQKRVLDAVLNRGRAEFPGLTAYLTQQEVLNKKRVALVDLGWGGTIHKSLQVLLQHISPQTRLTGYYMATFPEAQHSLLPGVQVRSYLAHRGQPAAIYNTIQSFLNLFESVYTSARGSVLHFDVTEAGTAVPVRQASDKSAEQCRNLHAIHQGALAFAEDYRSHPSRRSQCPLPPEVAGEEIFRVIQQPSAEEAGKLGGLVHCDNLGSSSTHVSVEMPCSDDPEEILEAFQHIHWKQGALSQPSAQAARLRTLLWLLEMQKAG